MFAKHLAAGLAIGAGLFIGATCGRADDTIVLKRAKPDDTAAKPLERDLGQADTFDVGRGGGGGRGFHGSVGHVSGFRGGFSRGVSWGGAGWRGGSWGWRGVGWRGGSWGWGWRGGWRNVGWGWRGPGWGWGWGGTGWGWGGPSWVGSGWSPGWGSSWVSPSFCSPSVIVTQPVIISSSTAVPTTSPDAGSVFRLPIDAMPNGNDQSVRSFASVEVLHAPRLQQAPVNTKGTFPYDGGPQIEVPMPRPDPAAKPLPPPTPPEDGKIVSLPAKEKHAYPAYGDKPIRSAFDDRTVLTREDLRKPSK